jgi:transglutaminase-like putative cysteine protease
MQETGNRYLRVIAPPEDLRLRYNAEVVIDSQLEDPAAVVVVTAANLPFEVVTHLYPSRECQVDKLVRFASTFGNLLCSRLSAVNGICNGIGENVKYQFEISDALTSAFHPVTERAGVCRDFPH